MFLIDRISLTRALFVGLIYFIAAACTVSFTRYGGGVAFVWIAGPILVAELMLRPPQCWGATIAACGLASFAATALFGLGLAAAAPFALANLAESIIAAALLRRLGPATSPLESLPGVVVFVFAVAVIAPGLTAPLAGLTLALTGADFASNAIRWYAGHALGALTFIPIAVLIFRGELRNWIRNASAASAAEALLIMLTVCATTAVVFTQARFPLLFLPILPLIVATFRIGALGGALSMIAITLVGGYLTMQGPGPVRLVDGSLGDKVQFFQFYLAVLVLLVLPVAADLSQRAALYGKLRESEARYRLLADNSSDVVMNLDPKGRISFASKSIRTIGGYDPAAVIGRKARDLVHPDDAEAVVAAHRAAFAEPGEVQIVEYRGLSSDGEIVWLESHSQGVFDQAGEPESVVSVVRSVGHRRGREQQLVLEATTDPLTGLLNRRSFFRNLEASLRPGRDQPSSCLALFDIDHFKRINDEHGHAAGDRVLEEFAAAAREIVRGDDMIARLGGEEFGVLLRQASQEQAMQVCNRLRTRIAGMTMRSHAGRAIRITVSAGVVPIRPGQSVQQTYQLADETLYRAKSDGRNRIRMAA